MEDDMPTGRPHDAPQRPSAAQARETLASLRADDANLAERLVTPRWYHPSLGVIVALVITSQALPSPASLILLPVALFALPALVVVYRRRYGLWFSLPAGPRSRRVYRILLAIVVACFAAMVVVKVTPVAYGWVLLPAAVGLVAPMVLGPRYDDLFRRELTGAATATDGQGA
ncbi:hypothetical protein H9623_12580 [Oerskovia sp. Sa1BUA8]|uniref:Uncharacterized protein n=1 Tax=Oerskovia douganii TaxID=2762210 RepID=A0A9D5U9R0_9CELL|nr:hypothetical protein [Oerskovia douganii]MBE7701134.1 hypothetical protein [Oerskovia douganii]